MGSINETDGTYSFDCLEEETVPLLRLSLRKLQDFDPVETERFFEASKDLGFFYLDFEGADNGSEVLGDVDKLFAVGEELFKENLTAYDFRPQGSYFGYISSLSSVLKSTCRSLRAIDTKATAKA